MVVELKIVIFANLINKKIILKLYNKKVKIYLRKIYKKEIINIKLNLKYYKNHKIYLEIINTIKQ